MNGDRIGRWTLTTFFAIMPTGLIYIFYTVQVDSSPENAFSETPEIAFTALMVSSISWSDLREARKKMPRWTLTFGEFMFFIGAVAAAVFYGMHSKSLYMNPGETDFRDFIANITLYLTLAALLFGTIFQILLARIEG